MKLFSGNFFRLNIGNRILLPAMFFLLLLSCREGKTENMEKLLDAESMIMSSPDSSLRILETINREELKKGRELALYGMLYTMALDKNYMDPKDDSLISYSSEYFRKNGEIENEIKSDYYRGRVLYHREEYPKALISFFKAKEGGEANEDYIFWAGMACRGISDIYFKLYNFKDNLYYSQKEYEYIKKSGIQPYLNYALLDLGCAYNNNEMHDKSLEITNQLFDSVKLYHDDNLYYNTLSLEGTNLYWIKNYSKSIKKFEEICVSEYSKTRDSLYLCLSFIEVGDLENANKLIEKISDNYLNFKNHIRFKLFNNKDFKDKSIRELVQLYNQTSNIYSNALNNSEANILTDYFELNRNLDKNIIRAQRYKIFLILTLSTVGLILMLLLFINKLKKYRSEIDKKMLLAEELQETLNRSILKNSESTIIIKNLMGSQYHVLEEVGEILYRNNDSNLAKKQIGNLLSTIIEDMSMDGKNSKHLIEQVDKVYDNIFTDFKATYPNFKQIDYFLFLYSILEFPASLISLLLKEDKITSVYNRKRNLKIKISNSQEDNKDRFLKYLV